MPTTPLIEVMLRIEPPSSCRNITRSGFGKVPRAFQICIDHRVPIFFLHAQDQSVAHDAGVVHQKIDAAESVFDLLHHFRGGFGVGHIALRCQRAHAERFDFGLQSFGGFSALGVVECDIRAASRQFKRDRPTDAAGPTSDNGHSARKGFS